MGRIQDVLRLPLVPLSASRRPVLLAALDAAVGSVLAADEQG
jgi:hypothetical protein